MGRAKRIWYLSPMRAAKVQASLRIRAVSPEPPLLAHTSSESRGTFRQKTRSLAPLNGWTCAVKVCHDGMLEDTNSLGAAQMTMDDYLRQLLNESYKSNRHESVSECGSMTRRYFDMTWTPEGFVFGPEAPISLCICLLWSRCWKMRFQALIRTCIPNGCLLSDFRVHI